MTVDGQEEEGEVENLLGWRTVLYCLVMCKSVPWSLAKESVSLEEERDPGLSDGSNVSSSLRSGINGWMDRIGRARRYDQPLDLLPANLNSQHLKLK